MNFAKNILCYILALAVPLSLARADTLYVANRANGTVSAIDPTGAITQYAVGLSGANGLARDGDGNLYVPDLEGGQVYRIDKTGGIGFTGGGLNRPQALAFNAKGDLYIANSDGTLGIITHSGTRSLRSTSLSNVHGIAFDSKDNLFISSDSVVSKLDSTGAATVFARGFGTPEGLVFDKHDNLFVVATGEIVEMDPSGKFTLITGSIPAPLALALDSQDNLFVSSANNNIYKVTPTGVVSTFAVGMANPVGLVFDRPAQAAAAATDTNTTSPPFGIMIALCAPAVLFIIAVLIWLVLRKTTNYE